MRANKKIFLSVICLLTFLICALSGCATKKYNAVLYDQAIEFNWFTEEYLADNIVVLSPLPANHPEAGLYPTKRFNVITSQEEFNGAFEYFPNEVNFEKEVLIVYFFCKINPIYADGRKQMEYYIKDINLTDKNLEITLGHRNKKLHIPGVADSGSPSRQCLIVRMDRQEFETVNIERE